MGVTLLTLAELESIEGIFHNAVMSPLDPFASSLIQMVDVQTPAPRQSTTQQHRSPLSDILFRDLVRETAEGGASPPGLLNFMQKPWVIMPGLINAERLFKAGTSAFGKTLLKSEMTMPWVFCIKGLFLMVRLLGKMLRGRCGRAFRHFLRCVNVNRNGHALA